MNDTSTGIDHQMSNVTAIRRGVSLALGTHKGILSCQAHLAGQDVHPTGSTSLFGCGSASAPRPTSPEAQHKPRPSPRSPAASSDTSSARSGEPRHTYQIANKGSRSSLDAYRSVHFANILFAILHCHAQTQMYPSKRNQIDHVNFIANDILRILQRRPRDSAPSQ